MRYRIGILERDRIYLARLAEFLRSHHGDSLEVHIAGSSHMDWNNMDLEDLDMDTITYDALFVGEGIDLEKAGVPAEVKVAYLVTQGYGTDKSKIIKYQRLEQIYQQMIAICAGEAEESEMQEAQNEDADANAETEPTVPVIQRGYHRFDTFELNTEQIEGGIYRVYCLPEDNDAALNEVEMGMLINNQIDGLAEVTWLDNMVYYQISNKISLMDFVRQNSGSNEKNRLLQIFANIVETMLGLDEYMLLPDKLILKPEEIYLDENTMKTALIYCPLQENNEVRDMVECLSDWIGVCEELIDGLNHTNIDLDNSDYTSYIPTEQIGEKLESMGFAQSKQGTSAAQEVQNEQSAWNTEEGQPLWETDFVQNADAEVTAWETGANDNGETEVFDDLQYAAEESKKAQKRTVVLQQKQDVPYLIREKTGEKILINRNIFKLGKDANYVDYCIKDNPTVSRSHADIVKGTEGCYIVDKGSLNHTFLNGRRIEAGKQEKLISGDVVQIADEVFEFMVGNQ